MNTTTTNTTTTNARTTARITAGTTAGTTNAGTSPATTVAPDAPARHAHPTDPVRPPGGVTRRRLLLTLLAAPAAALAVWLLAVPLAGVTLTARTGDTESTVGPVAIVLSTVLAGLAGWGLLALLERRAVRAGVAGEACDLARAGRSWAITAGVGTVLSLNGPLVSAVGAASTTVLLLLHLAVGAVLVPLLPRR